MLFFRRFLVRIKKEYNTNRKNLFLFSTLASVLFILIGIAADLFIPFNSWGNLIRTLILIPTATSMFIWGYSIAIHNHYKKIETDPMWVPFRARLSPTWRRRTALIVGAVLVVGVYANSQSIGYTPISSLFTAIVIGLVAFIRTTREEARREEFDIPDERDIRYDQQMKKIEQARKEAIHKKQLRKENRKNKNILDDETVE